MFLTEELLVSKFIEHIKSSYSPWGELEIGQEFFYQRGRTDIIGKSKDGQVIAFEAKLTKWKNALEQAYRNRCFADISYVLLPRETVSNAEKALDKFKKYGVGICCFDEKKIEVILEANREDPIQPWLRRKALSFASQRV